MKDNKNAVAELATMLKVYLAPTATWKRLLVLLQMPYPQLGSHMWLQCPTKPEFGFQASLALKLLQVSSCLSCQACMALLIFFYFATSFLQFGFFKKINSILVFYSHGGTEANLGCQVAGWFMDFFPILHGGDF